MREQEEGMRIVAALMGIALNVSDMGHGGIDRPPGAYGNEEIVEAVMWAFEEVGDIDDPEAIEAAAAARLENPRNEEDGR